MHSSVLDHKVLIEVNHPEHNHPDTSLNDFWVEKMASGYSACPN